MRTSVYLKRVLQLGKGKYDLETTQGEHATLSYNGHNLTIVYKEPIDNLSFSIEIHGLTEWKEYLHVAGFSLSPTCMVTIYDT